MSETQQLVRTEVGNEPYVQQALELLGAWEAFEVVQDISVMESASSLEAASSFKIYTSKILPDGKFMRCREVMTAQEHSGFFARQMLRSRRSFKINVDLTTDDGAKPVLTASRQCTLGMCTCVSTSQMTLETGTGESLGVSDEVCCAGCAKALTCTEPDGKELYRLSVGCWTDICTCCTDLRWDVTELGGDGDGEADDSDARIVKIYRGCFEEQQSDADTYVVVFPKKATPRQRALLLVSTFHMDILYYETGKSSKSRR